MQNKNTRRGFTQINKHVVICPPCGESTLKGGKGVVNKETLLDNPPSALCATSPTLGGKSTTRAFTLIELLVVVLIIGILAAVAVSQYQRAVEKAEEAKMLTILQSVAQAAQRYYLANGTYATSFNQLDVSFRTTPGSCNRDNSFDNSVIHVENYCITLVNFPLSVRISKYPGWGRFGNGKAFAYILAEGVSGWTRYRKGLYCITGTASADGKYCTGSIKYNNAYGKYYTFE